MLGHLSKCELCACMLPKMLKKSQPAVSQHLSVLKSAGLVSFRRDGAKRLYSLTAKGRRVLSDISKW